MTYYAIADLHGRFDLLRAADHAIDSHAANGSNTQIVTLGDYIDRGPDSRKIIEYLMNKGSNWHCLQGNHEAMLVKYMESTPDLGTWLHNGGGPTLQSYGWNGNLSNHSIYSLIPKEHYEWMRDLPLWYETEKQLFVHAGMPLWDMHLPASPKRKRFEHDMQWMVYDPADSGGWRKKHVVHGHHPSEANPQVWFDERGGGRTALDTYAYRTGRLVVGVFDDTQLSPIDFIEVVV